jgi:hypothetical protein
MYGCRLDIEGTCYCTCWDLGVCVGWILSGLGVVCLDLVSGSYRGVKERDTWIGTGRRKRVSRWSMLDV